MSSGVRLFLFLWVLTVPAFAEKPPPVQVRVDGNGTVIWDGIPLRNRVALEAKLLEFSNERPSPALSLWPSSPDAFQQLGPVVALMVKYHISVSFITR